ncbi:MAG TPA: helix-turn-helix transcriptional regulator [Saprospiraceae bacterium]|nr:helix-turn-helix transcriptional regulator [Saprospiraceae bacterium]
MSEPIPELPLYTIESIRTPDSNLAKRDYDLFRLESLGIDIERLQSPHRHHFYSLFLITNGHGSHDIDFYNYVLKPNRLFLIAPGQVHAWQKLDQIQGFAVLFTDSFVALSKGRKLMATLPLFRVQQHTYVDLTDTEVNRWIEELLHMEAEIQTPDNFSRDAFFYALGYLLVRVSRLLRQRTPKKNIPSQDILLTFQELIEKHFEEFRTPKDYAASLNITANYLNAICKKKSGKSAGELIRQRVLLEAKRLLAHTSLTVAEIAHKLNFEDNSYFGRYFKKYVGMTPETFRKDQRGMR